MKQNDPELPLVFLYLQDCINNTSDVDVIW